MKLTPFGLAVRKARLEHRLTLKAMATSLDVTSAYLSAVELGDKPLTKKVESMVMNFFASRLSAQELDVIQDAAAKTYNAVPLSDMGGDERVLVAAFARRLSEGEGVPDEVLNWLRKGGANGSGN